MSEKVVHSTHSIISHQPQFATIRYKLAIIGTEKVGKSSVMKRICQNKYDTEIGINAAVKQAVQLKLLDGFKGKIELVDIESKIDSDRVQFNPDQIRDFLDICGVLLVYDVTNRQSFDQLPLYLSALKSLIAPDCEIMLIGNKTDQIKQIGRAITFTDAESFASKFGLTLYEISAKSGEFCQTAILELVHKIREKWMLNPFGDEEYPNMAINQEEVEINYFDENAKERKNTSIGCRLWYWPCS